MMRLLKNISLSVKIVSAITACIIFFATCIDNEEKRIPAGNEDNKQVTIEQPDYNLYSGSAKCASCHRDIYEKHSLTSHFLTTRAATEKTIMGSFKKGRNTFSYNP